MFEPKRREVTGGWSKRHNEELDNLYSSLSINIMTKQGGGWSGHVTRITCRVLGKPKDERSLERRRCKQKANRILDLREIGRNNMV